MVIEILFWYNHAWHLALDYGYSKSCPHNTEALFCSMVFK